MLQQSADVPQRHLAQTRIQIAREQRLAALPQALVRVHAAAVIAEQRLGHERHGLAVLIRHVADDVLVQHHVVGGLHQRVEALIDFALAAGGDFVMMALDVEAALDHGLHHLGAQILIMIGGRNREIAFLVARPVAEVVLLAAGIPAAFFGVDEVEAGVLVLIEADVVEDEELGFGAEVGGVGEAAVLQVHLGFLGDPARVALVVLARDGIDHVAGHHQRRDFGERIHERGGRIGNQQHVALIDRRPAADATVQAEAFFEGLFVQLADGIGDVLLQAGQIGEAQIELLDVVLLREFETSFGFSASVIPT